MEFTHCNASLVESKLIDQLIIKRKALIDTFSQAVSLQIKATKLADEINRDIPTNNAGYIDDFSIVFIQLARALGETSKKRSLPRQSNLVKLSEVQLNAIVTKTVDSNLWEVVFNRLGFFGHMSQEQISLFMNQCRTEPLPFERENIEGTFRNIFENQEKILLDSLLDTVQRLSTSYRSNDTRKFTKKIIIDNALCSFGNTYRLVTHEGLQSLLTLIWRWVLVNKMKVEEDGLRQSGLWHCLNEKVTNSGGDIDELASVFLFDIEFRFFKKRSIHVLLPDGMLNTLNEKLASTKMLYCNE
ncbi:hypothetical protein VFMJ11_B0030 (plasmid) [Aliivibrio fischeri MJ11]|uniref:DUF4942 domain-containing protein n=1 Tax=Aliivibrio fischeri (strain MJ11) TaxID=388396 RepID=B5EVX3_ALIFM|nr:DUF4942 domain-containing protein [Aliivibrio fischeri]ACH64807.1 hypothetical protein VFMJ11_B0030 [Aliivibrio fischeri MJ11]